MATGPDAHGLKLLLLEAAPGSLATFRDVWPGIQIYTEVHDRAPGIVDPLSRQEVVLIICEVVTIDSADFMTLRRAHPGLPLIVVLPEPFLTMALTAFCTGVADVLVHQLDKATLLDSGTGYPPGCSRICRMRLPHRQQCC